MCLIKRVFLIVWVLSLPRVAVAGEDIDPYVMKQFREMVDGISQQEKMESRGIEDEELETAMILEKAALIEARRWLERKTPRWKFAFRERVGFNDNIFRAAHDQKSSVIFDQSPSVGVSYGNKRITAALDYEAGLLEYLNQPSQSRVDQSWDVNVHYFSNGKTGFDFYYTYDDREEAPNSAESLPRRTQDDHFTLALNRMITPKLTGHFRYDIRNTNFRKSTDKDNGTDTEEYSLEMKYRMSSKSSIFLGGSVSETVSGTRRFERTLYAFGGGIEGRIWPKTILHFGVSAEISDYDNVNTELSDFTVEGIFYHKVSRKTDLQLLLHRGTEFALDGVNSYFISNSVALKATSHLTPQLTVSLTGGWRINEGEGDVTIGGVTDTRDEDTLNLSGALQYKLNPVVSLGSNYNYEERFSSFDSKDFKNHEITAQVNISI